MQEKEEKWGVDHVQELPGVSLLGHAKGKHQVSSRDARAARTRQGCERCLCRVAAVSVPARRKRNAQPCSPTSSTPTRHGVHGKRPCWPRRRQSVHARVPLDMHIESHLHIISSQISSLVKVQTIENGIGKVGHAKIFIWHDFRRCQKQEKEGSEFWNWNSVFRLWKFF